MELNSRVTVPSLFNLHARLSDAPDSTRPCKSPGRHMGRTIFSHPKSRHRPVQSSTLICLPSIAPSLNFYVLPSTPSISVTFPLSPTAPIHLCPCLPSLQSFLLYHCRAPHCFSPSRVPFLSCLPKLLYMIMPSIFLWSAVHPPTLSKHAHKIFNPVIISRPFSYFVSTPISSLLQRLPTVYFPR